MARIGGQAIPARTLLLISGEGLLIFLALFCTTLLKLPPHASVWSFAGDVGAMWRLVAAVVVCVVSLHYHGLYDLQMVRSPALTSARVARGLGVALLILGVACLINSGLSPRQGVATLAAPAVVVAVMVWRWWLHSAGVSAKGAERVLIAGSGAVGQKLIQELRQRSDFNYCVIGMLSEGEQESSQDHSLPVLGMLEEVERVATEHQVDRVVVSLRERRGGMPMRALMRLKFAGIQVEDPYSLYERVTGRIVIENLSPSWLVFSDGFKTSRLHRWFKRAVDIVVALLGLVLTSPLMLLSAAAIAIEDGLPVFYRQERVGLNDQSFSILKFRSMRRAPVDVQPSWTGDRDPRITRVGKYLRKFRLDELPQFINVLRGEMSLIGPRPEQPYFCSVLEEKIPYFSYRHSVRPGITGWAQIKYGYGATTEDAWRKVELDLFYIKHLSLVLDLAILFETAKVVLFGRGR